MQHHQDRMAPYHSWTRKTHDHDHLLPHAALVTVDPAMRADRFFLPERAFLYPFLRILEELHAFIAKFPPVLRMTMHTNHEASRSDFPFSLIFQYRYTPYRMKS
jgi:hypothetical protein